MIYPLLPFAAGGWLVLAVFVLAFLKALGIIR
jgi:hypothetical protein